MELKYTGKVKDGILTIVNRKVMDKEILQFEGKEVEIIIRKKKRVRSLALNRYYFAEVVPKIQGGLKELGTRLNLEETDQWILDFFESITKEQAHQYLKDRFIEKESVDTETGEIKKNKITTTNMTNSQFQDFIAQIVQLGAEHLGVQILQPNEQAEINLT